MVERAEGPVSASVHILTKNADRHIREVLSAVVSQDTTFDFDVLVVDSESTDATLDIVGSFGNVRMHSISASEFGHGRTRNLAASLTGGAFLVFLTHDAVPVGRSWLQSLVTETAAAEDIAGAFGRHIAHDGADPYIRRDLERHFAGFLAHPLVVSKALDPLRYDADPGWRSFLHFFSDNNSCLRRSVWEKIPFADVRFAEDQLWAHSVINAGYAKAYAPDAVVKHSHRLSLLGQLRRAFDEAAAFRELFGYRLSTPARAVRSAIKLPIEDLRYGVNNKIAWPTILRRMVLDVFLVAGHTLGTYARRLPSWVRLWLSYDRLLYDSLRKG